MKCKIVVIVVLGLLFWGCENRYTDLDLRVYQYRDTKDLGKFVDDAS